MKICNGPICEGLEKDESCFNRRSARSSGLQSWCRDCMKYKFKEWSNKNKQFNSIIVLGTTETKVCHNCNIEKSTEDFYKHASRKDGLNPECKDCANKRQNIDKAIKRKTNLNFKLSCYLRSRLWSVVKKNKVGSAIRDLGCSVEFLKGYLESLFQPGMTWENYGEWHIDHIKALANFNLQNREEFIQAVNYTNLQPLWAKDNISKSNKVV